MATSRISLDLEAKLMIKVGDQQVELSDLAAALTRAGVELKSLIEPPESAPDHGEQIGTLHNGEGIFRDRNGHLRRVRLDELAVAHDEIPRVEGCISGRPL